MKIQTERGVPSVDRRPEGYVLIDSSDTAQAAYLTMGVAGCFVLFPLFIGGFILLAALGSGDRRGGIVAAIVLGVFLVVGTLIFRAGFKKFRVTQKWEPGELVSPEWPVPLGRAIEVRYRRRARAGQSAEVAMRGRTVLRESVTYRQGTDTRTVTEDVAEYPLEVRMLPSTAPGRAAAFTLHLPNDAPPSFELDNNRLQWWVLLDPIDESDGSEFKLWVRPEVAM